MRARITRGACGAMRRGTRFSFREGRCGEGEEGVGERYGREGWRGMVGVARWPGRIEIRIE